MPFDPTISLANWSSKLGSEDFVQSALKRAFAAWGQYAKLAFDPTDKLEESDITIAFGRYTHGDRHVKYVYCRLNL